VITFERLERDLAPFVTNSGRPPDDIFTDLTIAAASNTIPRLLDLARALYPERNVNITEMSAFLDPSSGELGDMFRLAGSDKSTGHDYHHLYAHILGPRRNTELRVLEIGMGTNFPDVVSSMGEHGRPGASLRAFRDFLPNARIVGADVDQRILFQEDRISTYFVDQTRPASFNALPPGQWDLIVDDGLHSTHANLAVVSFAIGRLRDRGWLVIEDIRESSLPVWHLAAILVPRERFETYIVRGFEGFLFVVRARG
jgi:hypothetical protein